MTWDILDANFTVATMIRGGSQYATDIPKAVPTELVFSPGQPSVLFAEENGVPFRGQEDAKHLMRIYIDALGPDDRIKALLTGPAGTGKTTLAWILAARIQDHRTRQGLPTGRFFEVLPAQIASKAELDQFMRELKPYDIVFVDEIHILRQNVGAEPLYHTLDDTGEPRYPLGNGQGWLDIPANVSWIGATTEPGELDGTTGGALRRRLSPEVRLEAPSIDTLVEILYDQSMPVADDYTARQMACRSGGLPWQVLNIYNTAEKVAKSKQRAIIDWTVANTTFQILGVDEYGLFGMDRDVIRTLLESPYKMRTGEVRYKMAETALCSAAGIDRHTYKEIVQPRLMRLGFLTTVGGQSLTTKAVELFS